jgi:hypothetical protein
VGRHAVLRARSRRGLADAGAARRHHRLAVHRRAPAIRQFGLGFLWTSDWDPVQERYGGLVMIYGTLMTSLIALVIACR